MLYINKNPPIALTDKCNVFIDTRRHFPVDKVKDITTPEITKISIGKSGVWGVDKNDAVWTQSTNGNWSRQDRIRLVQVSSGASVWGVNRVGEIYKYLGGGQWQKQINGGMTNVDVSNKDHVWAVDKNNNVWKRTGTGWQNIGGARLRQISVGESGVWGVDPLNTIYYRLGTNGDADTAGTAWRNCGGSSLKFRWIASLTNLVIGINSANVIFFRDGITAQRPEGSRWKEASLELFRMFPQLYRYRVPVVEPAPKPTPDEPVDKIDPAKPQVCYPNAGRPKGFTYFSEGESGIWGVDSNENIYKLNDDGGWNRINGKFVQVSSGASVWGVNRDNEIYKYLGDNQWQRIPGELTYVDVSNKGHVWGLKGEHVFRWTGSSWERISGDFKQISVGQSGVWGVNHGDTVFFRVGTQGDADTAGTGWKNCGAFLLKLRWLASLTNLVIGTNSANELFYRYGISSGQPFGTSWKKASSDWIETMLDSFAEDTYGIHITGPAAIAELFGASEISKL